MSGASIAEEIRRVIRQELDDCERALKNNDIRTALSELDDAVRKLRRLADQVHQLG
jgi:hypothetical protein